MIIYFSGTGNSRLVAEHLAGELGEECMSMHAQMLLSPEKCTLDTSSDRIVWVFPTYSWGVPPVVANVIANVQLTDRAQNARHYMVTTCGDDMAHTDRQWARLVHKRKLTAAGAFAVQMPNTYTLMKGFDVDPVEVAQAKLDAMPETVRKVANAIATNDADILIKGSFATIKSGIVYPWFRRFAMSPKPFHATDACVGCGICVSSCPMDNIGLDSDRRPRWSADCALCLSCYHHCPQHAVAYGHATDGKGQYLAPPNV